MDLNILFLVTTFMAAYPRSRGDASQENGRQAREAYNLMSWRHESNRQLLETHIIINNKKQEASVSSNGINI